MRASEKKKPPFHLSLLLGISKSCIRRIPLLSSRGICGRDRILRKFSTSIISIVLGFGLQKVRGQDKTILVEAMVLRLDYIGFLDTSNNNPSWKKIGMEGGVFRKNTIFRNTSDTFMDSNFTDEFMVQGYWCERADGGNFFESEPSISSVVDDPSPYLSWMMGPGSGICQSSGSFNRILNTVLLKAARILIFPWSNLIGSRKKSRKSHTKAEKTISLQVLRKYFSGSLKDAAKSIGVCPTTLKRICRQYGINRWPSRKIKKVNHSLRKLQVVVDSVMGAQGLIEVDSFYTAFPELSSPNYSGHNPFSSFKITDYSKESNPKPESHLLSTEGTGDSKSQSSLSSQNSGLSICHGQKQLTSTINGSSTVEDPVEALKRTCSKSEIHPLNQEEFTGAKTHETSGQNQDLVTPAHLPVSNSQALQDGGAFRVKATFGDENIRFSLHPNWGFSDLQREIAKRFDIYDFSRIGLKYLDNEQEAVLLTCDADLEECKDLLGFSQSRTIKITLYLVSTPMLGSSFSSSKDFF
ncbi:hypothetical protein OIU84_025260 [Salix udensis]|uniref:Uncharacterized protein n=1 Tax=Salix udensis TaxID=889485 RepID=A0AAD6PBJ1_9ROSI|nr:hypothetical protein OIU84_025260 [Salix udensis]